MRFQDAPTTLDRIVLAVIRRIVNQLDVQSCLVRELHDTIHELRSRATDLWSVVQVDLQTLDSAVNKPTSFPPPLHAVDDEIGCFSRLTKTHPELIDGLLATPHFENPKWHQKNRRSPYHDRQHAAMLSRVNCRLG